MATVKKSDVERDFRDTCAAVIASRDKPAIREAWNELIDSLIKSGAVNESAGDWVNPIGWAR